MGALVFLTGGSSSSSKKFSWSSSVRSETSGSSNSLTAILAGLSPREYVRLTFWTDSSGLSTCRIPRRLRGGEELVRDSRLDAMVVSNRCEHASALQPRSNEPSSGAGSSGRVTGSIGWDGMWPGVDVTTCAEAALLGLLPDRPEERLSMGLTPSSGIPGAGCTDGVAAAAGFPCI